MPSTEVRLVSEQDLLFVYAAAVGAFLFLLPLTACRARFELDMVRRCVVCERVVAVMLCLAQSPLLFWAVSEHAPLRAPFFGFVRPALGIVVGVYGIFASSHPVLGTVFMCGSSLFVVADSVSHVQSSRALACVRSTTLCTSADVLRPLWRLEFDLWRDRVGIVLGVWAVLLAAYLLGALGCCRPRFSVQQLRGGASIAAESDEAHARLQEALPPAARQAFARSKRA